MKISNVEAIRVSLSVILLGVLLIACERDLKNPTEYPLEPLSVDQVQITGGFWEPILETSRTQTLPHIFQFCEETGRFENFAKAGRLVQGPHIGERYNDTDVYKTIEGAAYHLQQSLNDTLIAYIDSIVILIEAAQEEDGYIFTPRTIDPETNVPGGGHSRWEDVWISHELYNAGHLYEAAVAYYHATGHRKLLDVAIKNADHVISVFNEDGLNLAPGHQEIEIGLVKLFRLTGQKKYLDQALFFLNQRGKIVDREKEAPGSRFEIYNEPSYLQHHKPVREQKEAIGHAVRAMYMYCGMTDAGFFGKDTSLLNRVTEIWDDITKSKVYITGGVGASHRGEAFSKSYDLPNRTAYCETCASVGSIFFNHRLFSLTSDFKYLDLLEVTMYNGLLSGVSKNGKKFFYPNPLESKGDYERSEWFGVACCPGNIARIIPSVPEYIYSKNENTLFVNLFIESRATSSFHGHDFTIEQQTNYPWDGKVKMNVSPSLPTQLDINIRIPGWNSDQFLPGDLYKYMDNKESSFVVSVNGEELMIAKGRNILISREWKKGDVIEFEIPIEAKLVSASKKIESDRGKLAIVRGPLVFAAEGIDNGGSVQDLNLSKNREIKSIFKSDLLGGAMIIKSDGVQAIPYFLWANRGAYEMRVWFPAD